MKCRGTHLNKLPNFSDCELKSQILNSNGNYIFNDLNDLAEEAILKNSRWVGGG